jgi:hypothetical protein
MIHRCGGTSENRLDVFLKRLSANEFFETLLSQIAEDNLPESIFATQVYISSGTDDEPFAQPPRTAEIQAFRF